MEFFNATEGGTKDAAGNPKKHLEDYDFWIRVGIRAVFFKRSLKGVESWEEAAEKYNGGGSRAANYRKDVVNRWKEAVARDKAHKEFIPRKL